MIELILATDMTKHAEIVSDLKNRLAAGAFAWDQVSSRLLMMKITIKAQF